MLAPGAPSVAGMVVTIGANTDPASQGLNTVSQQMNNVAKGGGGMASGLNSAMGLASAAVVGVGVASVKAAMTFEQAMRNVNSVAQLPEAAFQDVQDQIIDFSLTTRSSAENVALSLYKVVSAGLSLDESLRPATYQGKVMSEAMAVLMASSRAAGAGLAEVTDVTGILIPVMKAYGMSASESEYITDVFLQTVQSGIVTLPQLSGVLGRIIPLAANLGVGIEEVGYAFANMTNTGLTAEQTGTRMQAIFTQLIKPSKGLQEVIEKLGYTSGTELVEGMGGMIPALKAVTTTVFESTASIGGMNKAQTKMSLQYPFLVDQMDIYKQEMAKIIEKEGAGSVAAQKKQLAMDKLNQKMVEYQGELAKTTPAQQKLVKEFYGTNEGIAELFRNVRAIGGVMALTADDATMNAEAFDKWKDSIKGSVEAARAEQYKSLETQLKRLRIAFSTLGLEIGLTLIPPLSALIDDVIVPLVRSFLPPLREILGGVEKAFSSLPGPIQGVATALIALVLAMRGAAYVFRPFAGMLGINVQALTALSGPLAIAAAGVIAFGIAYKQNLFGMKEGVDNLVENGKNFINYLKAVAKDGDTANDWLTHLPEQYQKGAKAIGEFVVDGKSFLKYIGSVAKDGDYMNEFLTELPAAWLEAALNVGVAISKFRESWSEFNQIVTDNVAPAWESIKQFFSTGTLDTQPFENIIKGLGNAINDSFGYVLRTVVSWVKENAPAIWEAFLEWASGVAYWVGKAVPLVISALGDLIADVLGWIVGTGVPTLVGAGVALMQGVASGFKQGTPAGDLMAGLIATIQTSLGNIEASLVEAGATIAGHVFRGFQNALVTMFGQTQANAILGGVMEVVNKLETIFKPTFDRIAESAKGFGAEMALLKPKFENLKSALMGLVGPASVIGQVLAGVTVVLAKFFGEVIGQAIERLPEIIGGIVDFLTGSIQTFTDVFMGIVAVVKAILAGDFTAAFDAAKQTVADWVSGSTAQLEGLLVVVDNVVGGVYDSVVNTFNDITGATLPSWDELKNGIVERFETIKSSITGAIEDIKAKIEPIASALQPVFETLKSVFEDVKRAIWEFGLELGPIFLLLAPIKEAMAGAFEGMKDAFITAQPALEWLGKALLTISGIIMGVIGGSVVAALVVFGEILAGIFQNAGTVIRGFGQILAGVFDVIRSIFYSFISFVKSAFQGDFEGAAQAGIKAWEAFKEGIAGIFNGISNIIIGTFGTIYDIVVGIANKIPGISLSSWEEVTKGFEYGSDKVKTSATDTATVVSGMSSDIATATSSASSAVANSLSSVAGSTDVAKTGFVDFAGYTGTYMEQAAGSTQSYSDQIVAAFGKLPPSALDAATQTATAMAGIPTSVKSAQSETQTATTSLIDGILAKMNGLVGQVTGPKQIFDDLKASAADATSTTQTNLNDLVAGWNTSFAQLETAPQTAMAGIQTSWQSGLDALVPATTTAAANIQSAWTNGVSSLPGVTSESMAVVESAWTQGMGRLPGVTQTEIDKTVATVTTGFGQMAKATQGPLETIDANVSAGMSAINKTVNDGLKTVSDSYISNWTDLQAQDLAFQSTSTANQQAYFTGLQTQATTYQTATTTGQSAMYTSLAAGDLAYQTNATLGVQIFAANQIVAWTALSTGVQGQALVMTAAVQMRFAEFGIWLDNYLNSWLVPAVKLAFDLIYLIILQQMTSAAGAMQAGWMAMLGGTRASTGAMRSEVNTQMSGMIGELRGYAGEMFGVGQAIGGGLAAGIQSMIGAAIAAAVALVNAAIAAAWAAAMAHSPSKIMMDLGEFFGQGFAMGVAGQGTSAAQASASIIYGAVAAAKAAAGISSPSDVMANVGWDFIMGLIQGMTAGEKEAIDKAVELMDKIMSSISNVVRALSDLSGFKAGAIDLTGFKEQIRAVVEGLQELANFYADPANGNMLTSAKAVLDPVSEVFSKLSSVISGIKSLFDPALLDGTVSDAQTAVDTITAAVKVLVVGFADAAGELKDVGWPAAVTLAGVAGTISENIKAVVEAFDALANMLPGGGSSRITLVTNFIVSMVTAFSVAAGKIKDETKTAAIAFAGLATTVVSPISEAVSAIEALLSVAASNSARIEATAKVVVNSLVSLSTLLGDAFSDALDDGTLKKSAAAAELLVKVLAPWKDAVETLGIMAGFVFQPVGPIAEKIKEALYRLARKLAFLASDLGPDMIAQSQIGAEIVGSILDPWKNSVETLKLMAEYVFRPVGPTAESIKQAVYRLARKLAFLAGDLGPDMIAQSKIGAALMTEVLDPWVDAVKTLSIMAAFTFRPVGPIAESIRQAVYRLARKLSFLADDLGPDMIARSKAGAALMSEVLVPWEAAVETLSMMAAFTFRPIGTVANRIILSVGWLSLKLAQITDTLGPQIVALAKEGAKLFSEVLDPWQAAIETLEAMAEFAFKPIGPTADKIILTLGWLALKLSQITDTLGPQIIALAKEGASLFSEILVPWQAAMDTLSAMADFIFTPIGPVANKIVLSVAWLSVKLAEVTYTLGPQTIALAKEGASLFTDVLAPWEQSITVLNALASYIARNVTTAVNAITGTMRTLANALSSMADDIGMDVLKKAAKVGKLLSEVLSPWETAIKLADEMRAFRIMPDFVDKMVRFGRQWIEVVDQLGRIILTLNQDGLDAVEDFATVLTALVGGLTEAMAILEDGNWPEPSQDVWDRFMQWVWGIFRFFYDKIQELQSNPSNIIGFEPVGVFAAALESLMNSLSSALTLARDFEFIRPDPTIFESFEDWVWDIFQFFYDKVLELYSDPDNIIGFDPVAQFASALEAILNSLSLALEIARNFTFERPDETLWTSFEDWVWDIFQFFYDKVLTLWNNSASVIGFDPVEAFGNALSAILESLSAALEIARNFSFVEPDATLWAAFVAWVWRIFQEFFTLVQTLWNDPARIIDFAPVEAFGNALSAIMGGLSAALEVVSGFEFTAPGAEWDNFILWVTGVFTTLYNYVQSLAVNPDEVLDFSPVEAFGAALESIMGGLAAALELVSGFQFTPPDPGIWDSFIGWVTSVFDSLSVYITTNYPQTAADAEAFGPVAAFGSALEAIMGGLASALEVFSGLLSFAPPMQATVDSFLSAVQYVFTQMSAFVVANISPAATAAVETFSGALSELLGGLADALSLFNDLADASDVTMDFIAGASSGSDTSLFMQRMGYLFSAVNQTILRFQALVVDNLGSTWIPAANAFSGALETVLGVLRTALDLFVDLEAANMPTSSDIETFISQVINLFTRLTTELGNVVTPLNSAVEAILLAIRSAPATIVQAAEQWAAAGAGLVTSLVGGITEGVPSVVAAIQSLVTQMLGALTAPSALAISAGTSGATKQIGIYSWQGLVTGLQSGQGPVYNAAYALAMQILAGVNAGLGTGSPSREMATIGGWAGEGFSIGLDKSIPVVSDSIQAVLDTVTNATDAFNAPALLGPVVELFKPGQSIADMMDSATAMRRQLAAEPLQFTPVVNQPAPVVVPGNIELTSQSQAADIETTRRLEITLNVVGDPVPAMSPADIERFKRELVYEIQRYA